MAKEKKRPTVYLAGTATVKAKVQIEAKITDSKYEVGLLKEDIHFKRVGFEPPTGDEGWMKLLYSADGPTGDPFPIGKVRIYLDADELDQNFGDMTYLSIDEK